MNEILDYLKKRGECLDIDIATATGIPLAAARIHLAELAANNEVMVCLSTRFEKGKKIENVSCRISGYIPKAAPGRKSVRVNLKLS